MKLLYATSIDLPSTRANRIQIISMARALGDVLKNQFILGLRRNESGPLGISVAIMPQSRSIVLAWQYMRLVRGEEVTHVYCREERLLFLMMLYNRVAFRLPVRFFYEIHHMERMGWWYSMLVRRADGIVAITHGLKRQLVRMHIPEDKVLVAPDAVTIATFDIPLTKDEARRTLGLPEGFLAMYTGTIHEPWKGVGVLYEAAKLVPDVHVIIVGGKPHYVDYFKSLHPPIPNVTLLGHKPHEDIPVYLKAADVLVLPNSGKEEISRVSTSPMKLFEYMASGRAIVASNLPSVREVLDESMAMLVAPDEPQALAGALQALAKDPMLAEGLAKKARQDVETYTWEKRARAVSDFITHHA